MHILRNLKTQISIRHKQGKNSTVTLSTSSLCISPQRTETLNTLQPFTRHWIFEPILLTVTTATLITIQYIMNVTLGQSLILPHRIHYHNYYTDFSGARARKLNGLFYKTVYDRTLQTGQAYPSCVIMVQEMLSVC